MTDVTIGRASTRGVMWNGATFGLSKVLVLVTTVVLARLLTPDDFGLVAIGLLVMSYLDLVNDFGVNAAVVQHEGPSEHTANVAFWVNMALGTTLTLVGLAIAPFVADFFDEPRATTIVRVLSLTLLLTSLAAIHEARLRRDMRFQRRLIPELARAITKGGTSIVLAVAGAGVWSLVWGQVAGELVAAIAYWIVMPWRPKWRRDRALTRRLLGFGSHIALVGVFGTILRNIDYVVVGRALGARALGLYTLAFRMPQLIIEGAVTIVGQVAFPAFARVQSDQARLRSGLLRGLRLTALVITPLSLGLAVVADPFIRTFYGSRWTAAIGVMQLLALYMLVQGATRLCGDVYKATGRAGLLSRLALLKLAITVPLLVLVVERGIVAVAAAQLVAATACTLVDVVAVTRVVDVGYRDIVGAFVPAARAGGVMAAACLGASGLASEAAPAVELVVVSMVGFVSFAGALVVLDHATVDEVRRLFSRGRGDSAVPADQSATPANATPASVDHG
jgi:lipopolysaccharide exporter